MLAAVVVAVPLLLTGCGSSVTGRTAAATDAASYTAIIDVRTPSEFADGHVENALNIDVTAPGFDQAITELSRSGTYLVYCRSGNRSAQAAERMRSAGLDVADGGGLDDMREAGYPFTA